MMGLRAYEVVKKFAAVFNTIPEKYLRVRHADARKTLKIALQSNFCQSQN